MTRRGEEDESAGEGGEMIDIVLFGLVVVLGWLGPLYMA